VSKRKRKRIQRPLSPDNARYNERPTPERAKRGQWAVVETAEGKHLRDMQSHPIDALEREGRLSSDQASAARDFEELYRAQCEIAGTRDSCTIWEPRGHSSDDGPVEERRRYRELCRDLGMLRERRLQWVIIEGNEPRARDVGKLREDLNELARFFGRGKRYA